MEKWPSLDFLWSQHLPSAGSDRELSEHLGSVASRSPGDTVDGSEIRRSPLEVGSSSHDKSRVLYILSVVGNGISEPSAVAGVFVVEMIAA